MEAAADLAWEYCFHLAWQYRPQDMLAISQRALAALGDAPRPQRIRLLAMRGMAFSEANRFAEASALIEEASRLADATGDPCLIGEVGCVETVHHAIFMQLRGMVQSGRRAASMLRQGGALWTLADTLCFVDQGLVFQGRFDESDEVADEAGPLADRIGHYASASVLRRRTRFPKMAAQRGSLQSLDELADVQFAVSADMGSPMWLAYAHTLRGMVRLWQGDWETARPLLQEGARLALPGLWFGPHHGLLLLLHALGGEREEAYALLDSVALPTPGTPNMIGAWTLGIMAAEAVSLLGDQERAAALYPLVVEAMASGSVLRMFDGALIERVAGMAAACARLPEMAEEHFQTALRQAKDLPHIIERPQVHHRYGRFLLDRGGADDMERARTLFDEAVAGYRAIGMLRNEAMALGLLAPLAHPPAAAVPPTSGSPAEPRG